MLAQYIAGFHLAMAKYPLWFDEGEPLYTIFRVVADELQPVVLTIRNKFRRMLRMGRASVKIAEVKDCCIGNFLFIDNGDSPTISISKSTTATAAKISVLISKAFSGAIS